MAKKKRKDTTAADIRAAHAAGNAFDRMLESAQAQVERAKVNTERKKHRAEKNKAKKLRQKLRREGKLPPVRVADYTAYLQSKHWQEKRLEAFEHYGRRCRHCGSPNNLHVHHKNYARLHREQMKDLEVLCGLCHTAHHEADPKWLKRHGRVQGQCLVDAITTLKVGQA